MKIRYPALGICLLLLWTAAAQAQTFRNRINTRFNTVATGPMQALIVDAPNADDTDSVRRAVAAQINAERRSRDATLREQMELFRRATGWRRPLTPAVPDLVIVRQKGRLVLPQRKTRAPDLTFTFPAATEPGGWTAAQQNELKTIIDIVYPELKSVYGAPSWTGTVRILNGDTLPPGQLITDPDALSGGVYNISSAEITFRRFESIQSTVLSLTQMLALAFRGPASISYDAWERGMARAATAVTVRNVLPLLNAAFGSGAVDVADPLWSALDIYDLLNQPPLGNDRFYPVSKKNGQVNTPSFPLMLFHRLRMSGSAWLKVATEDPLFFRTFNTAYYTALGTDPNLKNSVPALKQLAKTALATDGATGVEGMEFLKWYDRQFVLDTSVSPGTKLFAWPIATRPQASDDDFAVGVVLYYYRTGFDGSGNSDETSLNGTCFPIYWDYTFQNRLFLAAQYERVDIRDGQSSVAPTFFNTIGGDPTLEGRMRVTMDFPVNFENLRLSVAPRSMGKQGSANNFWGVVIGADTGRIKIESDTGVTAELDVRQGAFGGAIDAQAFRRPARATLTFTDTANNQTVRRVVTGYNEYVAVFYVEDAVDSRTHSFPSGPAMISFPIQPLQPKAAQALLNPANDQPLFNDSNLLMAQWRQNLPGEDKYQYYPTMEPLQPGKGYWSLFPQSTNVKIIGRIPERDQNYSIGLINGWNQIGNPYETPININDLQFQYLADNLPVGLQEAVDRGWIVAQEVTGMGKVVVWRYNPTEGYVPATTLEPWVGYWIRVLVSEGVTLTYPNPSRAVGRTRVPPSRAAASSSRNGWSVQLSVRGPNSLGAVAYLGQANDASAGYDAKRDAQLPPPFTRAAPSIAFPHPDWGANAGDYFSDIRRAGARETWDVTVYTPEPNQTYTLGWSNLSTIPRHLRLLLVDTATGRRQYLHGSSGYTFTSSNAPTRKFQIVTELRGLGGLRITNLVVQPTRAGGGRTVEIAFDLSQGATVQTTIRSADGRLLRRLQSGRAAPAGTNRLLWDTRDERAIAVPSGAYLIEITAQTPEGETARVLQPVTIVR